MRPLHHHRHILSRLLFGSSNASTGGGSPRVAMLSVSPAPIFCRYDHQMQPHPPSAARSFCFKSSISLDNLYPESSLNIAKMTTPPKSEPTKFSGFIPMSKISVTFSRSSGPGGQNVNKVNSKVNIKFKVENADWIPDIVRRNFIEKFKNQITKDGDLTVTSDRTPQQHLNTADALQKLREMIRSCEPVEAPPPDPQQQERLRRRREKAARERLLLKRHRSNLKGSRGAV